jgi:hypothetical protein
MQGSHNLELEPGTETQARAANSAADNHQNIGSNERTDLISRGGESNDSRSFWRVLSDWTLTICFALMLIHVIVICIELSGISGKKIMNQTRAGVDTKAPSFEVLVAMWVMGLLIALNSLRIQTWRFFSINAGICFFLQIIAMVIVLTGDHTGYPGRGPMCGTNSSGHIITKACPSMYFKGPGLFLLLSASIATAISGYQSIYADQGLLDFKYSFPFGVYTLVHHQNIGSNERTGLISRGGESNDLRSLGIKLCAPCYHRRTLSDWTLTICFALMLIQLVFICIQLEFMVWVIKDEQISLQEKGDITRVAMLVMGLLAALNSLRIQTWRFFSINAGICFFCQIVEIIVARTDPYAWQKPVGFELIVSLLASIITAISSYQSIYADQGLLDFKYSLCIEHN